MANLKVVNTADFKAEVLESDGLVLVDFFAPWCPPCRRLEPELEAVSTELGAEIKIVKVNVDDDEPLSLDYNVSTIPNMTYFRDGKVVDQVVGLQPKRDVIARIKKLALEPAAK